MTKQRPGALTIVAVFLIGAVALIILMADNIRVVQFRTEVHAQAVSEQAFYAAQSCLEDGYYHLKTDASYGGVSDVNIGQSTCSTSPTVPNAPNGALISRGTSGQSVRTIVSNYSSAGPTTVHLENDIVHVIDRSGSMNDSSCTIPTATTATACATAGGQWLTKLTQAKTAATNFTVGDMAAPSVDQIGVVSFSTHATLEHPLTASVSDVTTAIAGIAIDNTTNISEAITMATATLQPGAGVKKFMILLTDGIPNEPHGACTATATQSCDDAITAATIAKNAANQNTIIVIGLGSDVNVALLKQIASPKTDGTPWYYFAPSAASLQSIYTDIASQLRQYNLGQGSWNEQ